MLKKLLIAAAFVFATLSAPAALAGGQHALADGFHPPVEASVGSVS